MIKKIVIKKEYYILNTIGVTLVKEWDNFNTWRGI